jgi:hypothetical protein
LNFAACDVFTVHRMKMPEPRTGEIPCERLDVREVPEPGPGGEDLLAISRSAPAVTARNSAR